MNKDGYVYIMASITKRLYIGVTSDLEGRVWEHKEGVIDGFTKKYNIKKLVYYEIFDRIEDAISREKQLKDWHRSWKLNLIKKDNPTFKDLYQDLF